MVRKKMRTKLLLPSSYSDKSCFTRNETVNFRNIHILSVENPHKTATKNFQHTFSINVWVVVIGDYFGGPFFLPSRLTGEAYLHFLETNLPTLFEV